MARFTRQNVEVSLIDAIQKTRQSMLGRFRILIAGNAQFLAEVIQYLSFSSFRTQL
jgi:hypothetical protein